MYKLDDLTIVSPCGDIIGFFDEEGIIYKIGSLEELFGWLKMKLSIKLLTDNDEQTGYAFEVKGIPSKYIGKLIIDELNKTLNGYDQKWNILDVNVVF